MKKSAFLLLALFLLFQTALAQKGRHITKRVAFPRGTNSTVIRGKARWGASYIYLLRARAGQRMSIRLEGVPVVRVVPPGAQNYEA